MLSTGTLQKAALRTLEGVSVTVFFSLLATLGFRLWPLFGGAGWFVLAGTLGGYVLADLVSGVVHWAADTWGDERLPIVGPALLRPFREHHFDPSDITRHGFFETNGNSCLVSLPVLAGSLWLLGDERPGAARVLLAATLGAMVFFVMLTNQFHKWAHAEQVPVGVRTLQRLGWILGREHHARHHAAPFASHYAITTGLWNRLLDRSRVFRRLERFIHRTFGFRPRRDERPHRPHGQPGEGAARAPLASET